MSMKIKWLAATVVSFSLLAQPVSAASEQGWILEQITEYSGLVKTEITNHGCRTNFRGITLIFGHKAGRLTLLGDKAHSYLETTVDSFMRRYCRDRKTIAMRPLKDGKDGTVGGLKAHQYFSLDLQRHGRYKEFWTTNDLKVPTSMCDTFLAILDLPTGKGFPIRFIQKSRQYGSSVVCMDTLKVKRAAIPNADFQVPKGWKRAADEIELLESTNQDKSQDSLIDLYRH